MKIFNRFFKEEELEEKIVQHKPIDVSHIEKIIELTKMAKDTVSDFELCFELEIGEFNVNSRSLKDIKLLKKTKNDNERILINYSTLLLDHDVTIQLEHIVGVYLRLQYFVFPQEKEEGDVDV